MRLRAVLAFFLVGVSEPMRAQVQVERVNYKGWQNSYKLSNGLVEVFVVADVGPRIIDFRQAGGENVFHVREEEAGKSGEKEWMFRGGWRFWIAPEKLETTYIPDNEPCKVKVMSNRKIVVTGPPQRRAGIQKIIEVEIFPNEPRVRITQRLKNTSRRNVEYAIWSLSVMKPGGKAFAPIDELPDTEFAAIRSINFWSYAEPTDPRYRFLKRLIIVDTKPIQPAPPLTKGRRPDESKIGVNTMQGWVAYLNDGVLYLKRFPHDPKGHYPDKGSTVEIYSCAEFLECENLSPLTVIKPGRELVYVEDWYLFAGVQMGESEEEMLQTLQSYLAKTKPVMPRQRTPKGY